MGGQKLAFLHKSIQFKVAQDIIVVRYDLPTITESETVSATSGWTLL
jgi:hypothetical protein